MMRLLDMFFSALAMLALVPLFLLVSVILYLTGEGEILFVQKRLGRGGIRTNQIRNDVKR
jgi:lipopolysaccharide/colanic/teichoic acid biosynthesis glycosyltransferase